ncbi:MAG: S26 family signal peptidase [Exilispira sp.]
MYIRDFESYKSKRKMPLLIWIVYQYLIFSLVLAIIFSIITPIRSNDKELSFNKNSFYFLQNNLFFINFEIKRGDFIIIDQDKVSLQKIFVNKLINVFSLNIIKSSKYQDIYKVLALPYDIVSIKDGILFINGKEKLTNVSTSVNKDQTFYLSKDQYFCISIIKNSIDDSSFIGIISKDYIAGRILNNFNSLIDNE